MPEATIGFIGGSGLYEMSGLSGRREIEVSTPFGGPSDSVIVGMLEGVPVAFLPRHGRGHRISPTDIPVRANLYALKSLGVERVVSVSAVGSLREEMKPLDLVVPDQLVDRTRERPSTFFGCGIVAHVGLADPFCPEMRQIACEVSQDFVTVHESGTYVVIEGPQFSTRAESQIHRSWGAGVVGMTALPEARLAREAEMCYVTLAFVTDYDVWHGAEEDVSVELVLKNLLSNVDTAQRIIRSMVPRLTDPSDCGCGSALENAIITSRNKIPHETRNTLGLLINKYLEYPMTKGKVGTMPRQVPGEPYTRVSIDEAAELHDSEDHVFVDVRRLDEYVDGHVKDALFITVDDLLARIDELPQEKNLMFICAAGVRSGLACEMAAAMGFDSDLLFNVEDGTGPWIEKGYPTSYGSDK